GSGNKELSAVGLAQFMLDDQANQLSSLAKLSVKELCQYKGIGPAKAVSLKACFELGRRQKTEQVHLNKIKITSSKTAFDVLYTYLNGLVHEEVWILFLSRSNAVISVENLSKGGLSSTVIDLKILFKKALLHQCSGLILAHNHPSGSAKASQADLNITKKIKDAAVLFDIQLLDHLIFYDNRYLSMADENLMP
ncbi:MAG: JAB domain-containing protein, partial [Flavobacteriales bacterium]